MTKQEYADFALRCRRDILDMVYTHKVGFIGSSFSAVDLLTVLFCSYFHDPFDDPQSPERDLFLLSKGHAASGLYAVLAQRGFFPREKLSEFCDEAGGIGVHPKRGSLPGVEVSSGSLGNGLGMGCGAALANRYKKSPARTFVLLGDGECNEGSIWESAMFASRCGLESLTTIVDRNCLQSYGRDDTVLNMNDMAAKFAAFGWNAIDVDGHDYDALHAAFAEAIRTKGKPSVLVAHTVKGKGVSFMEDRVEWHYKWPTDEQYKTAREELN